MDERTPKKTDKEAWLWPNNERKKDRPITMERFDVILKKAARKARISKRVHSHLLRHSRATFLARFFTEYQMRFYFGWSKTSEVPARYVHLSGRDTDDALFKLYGISADNEQMKCPHLRRLIAEMGSKDIEKVRKLVEQYEKEKKRTQGAS